MATTLTAALGGSTVVLKRGSVETHNNLYVPAELRAELQAKAAAEGKTVDELAEQALRKGLEDRAWQDLLSYGRERGQASGYTEEEVPDVVRENRRRHRQRI